jgi:hypothetical protein
MNPAITRGRSGGGERVSKNEKLAWAIGLTIVSAIVSAAAQAAVENVTGG